MIDKLVSRSCNNVICNLFFILISCENERSLLQMVTLRQRNILVATYTFRKVSSNLSAFFRVCKAAEMLKSII